MWTARSSYNALSTSPPPALPRISNQEDPQKSGLAILRRQDLEAFTKEFHMVPKATELHWETRFFDNDEGRGTSSSSRTTYTMLQVGFLDGKNRIALENPVWAILQGKNNDKVSYVRESARSSSISPLRRDDLSNVDFQEPFCDIGGEISTLSVIKNMARALVLYYFVTEGHLEELLVYRTFWTDLRDACTGISNERRRSASEETLFTEPVREEPCTAVVSDPRMPDILVSQFLITETERNNASQTLSKRKKQKGDDTESPRAHTHNVSASEPGMVVPKIEPIDADTHRASDPGTPKDQQAQYADGPLRLTSASTEDSLESVGLKRKSQVNNTESIRLRRQIKMLYHDFNSLRETHLALMKKTRKQNNKVKARIGTLTTRYNYKRNAFRVLKQKISPIAQERTFLRNQRIILQGWNNELENRATTAETAVQNLRTELALSQARAHEDRAAAEQSTTVLALITNAIPPLLERAKSATTGKRT